MAAVRASSMAWRLNQAVWLVRMAFGQRRKRRVVGEYLRFVDIETGAGQTAGIQGGGQRDGVDQAAPGDIDQNRAAFHQGDAPGADQVAVFGRQRAVERDQIGLTQQIVQRERFGPWGRVGKQRVVAHDASDQRSGQLGQSAANPPETDQSERQGAEPFQRTRRDADPASRSQDVLGRVELTVQGEEHGQGVDGHLLDAVVGGVSYGETTLRGAAG